MQPRTPESEIRRAGEAERILNDPVFKESFEQIEQALLSGMRSAGIVDDKLRLRLLDKYEALQSVRQVLQSTMETGRLAKEQLEMEKKKNIYQMVRDKFG